MHVYGRAGDDDVRVAREIDAGESLGLIHVDKSQLARVPPTAFGDVLEQNFYAFDGCPPDGIFTGPADLATRRDRCSQGELMLNGGGGEIFRNFFYLRDVRFTVRQVLWSFYSQFDPLTCTPKFSEHDYHRALGDKMQAALGISHDRLSRHEVELIYPLFRCRFWMGQNNSINNRLGYALTPFIEYSVVRDAVKVPIKYKNFGHFEANMIRAVDARLAGYPSSYGHNFIKSPPPRRIAKDLVTHLRPCWLRGSIYRIRNRLRHSGQPVWLSAAYRQAVMDDDFPYLRHWFQVGRIHDSQQLNRICTLEYLFQKIGPRIDGA